MATGRCGDRDRPATGALRSRRGRRDEDGGVAESTGTARQGRRRRGTGRRQREVGDEKLKFFEVFSYIGDTFSTGWSHQPVLKVCFGQAKRREAHPL